MYETRPNTIREQAILVAVKLPHSDGWPSEETLEELSLLADTAGADVLDTMIQARQQLDPATLIGAGKITQIAQRVQELNANLVIFDDDLTPAQARNLEKAIGVKILDRSALILDIFARRAKSIEAKTQVELAQLKYMLPRLTRQWTHLSRQEGGIGTRGPGETQLEVDRRRVRKRIADLSAHLERIAQRRAVRRKKRGGEFVVSLVGYTNTGKSTLLNALSQAGIYTENKLFATLDPTTRAVLLNGGQKVLITDTVGLIRKLPHHLIVSFHSTLEELVEADLLLHIIDISNENFEEQMKAVQNVLQELGAHTHPLVLVFNKMDKIAHLPNLRDRLLREYPEAIFISALKQQGLEKLSAVILNHYERHTVELSLQISLSDPKLISQIYALGEVLDRQDGPEGVSLRVRLRGEDARRLKNKLSSHSSPE